MQFEPKTDRELLDLWPEGEYSFEVAKADETTSSNGNDMIVLHCNVYNEEGRVKVFRDYLVESVAFKLKASCKALGLLDAYNTGKLSALDFEGKKGELKLGIEEGKDGYQDRNKIVGYVIPKLTPAQEKHTQDKANGFQPEVDLDDEIGF